MRGQQSINTSDEASSASWQEGSRYDATSPRSIHSDDQSSFVGSAIGHDDPTLVHANYQQKTSYDIKRVHSSALDSFLTASYSEDGTQISEIEETRESVEARDKSSEDRFQQQLAELDQTQEAWKATQAARSDDSMDSGSDFYLKEVGELTVLSPRKKKYDLINETIYEEEESRELREDDIREEAEPEKPSKSEPEDPLDTTNDGTEPPVQMAPEPTSPRNDAHHLRSFKAESPTETSKTVEMQSDNSPADAVEPVDVQNEEDKMEQPANDADGGNSDGAADATVSRVVTFGTSFDDSDFDFDDLKRDSKNKDTEHRVDHADLEISDRTVDSTFIDLEDNVIVPNTSDNVETNDTNEIIKAVQARLFNFNMNEQRDAASTESDDSSDHEQDPELRSYLPANLSTDQPLGSPLPTLPNFSIKQTLPPNTYRSLDEDDASNESKLREKKGKRKLMVLNCCIILAVVGAIICTVGLVIEIRGSRSGEQPIDNENDGSSNVTIDNNGYTITLIDNDGNSTESINSSGEGSAMENSIDGNSSESVPSAEMIDEANVNDKDVESSTNENSPSSTEKVEETVEKPVEIRPDYTEVEAPTNDTAVEDPPSEIVEELSDISEDRNVVIEAPTNDTAVEDPSPEAMEEPTDMSEDNTVIEAPMNDNSLEESTETVEEQDEILDDNTVAESPMTSDPLEDSSPPEVTEEQDEIPDDNTVAESPMTSDPLEDSSPPKAPEATQQPEEMLANDKDVESPTNGNPIDDSPIAEVIKDPNTIDDFNTVFESPTNGIPSEITEEPNEDNAEVQSRIDGLHSETWSADTIVSRFDPSDSSPDPSNERSAEARLREISGGSIYDVVSPQYKATDWLLNKDPANLDLDSMTDEDLSQRYIAALLYFSTDGKRWVEQYNFLTDAHVCEWNTNSSRKKMGNIRNSGTFRSKLGVVCNEFNKITGFAISKYKRDILGQLFGHFVVFYSTFNSNLIFSSLFLNYR